MLSVCRIISDLVSCWIKTCLTCIIISVLDITSGEILVLIERGQK